MSRLTRDGTAEPVSRDQNIRRKRGQGNVHFSYSADHEQDWQPCPVDPYSAIHDGHILQGCVTRAIILKRMYPYSAIRETKISGANGSRECKIRFCFS